MFTNRVVWITGASSGIGEALALRFARDNARNALAADGSAFGEEDKDIAGGMDVGECADVIIRDLDKGKREIPVGKGKEMAALWVKRLAPEMMFKIAKKQN